MATLEQIADALRKADAAGNVDDARALAAAYRSMQGQQQTAPAPAGPPQPTTGAQMAQDLNLPIPGTPMTEAKPAEPSMVPWLDPVSAFANSAVDAIPVAGPTLTNMAQNGDAALNSLITGQPYDFDRSWQERVGINADQQSQYPEASTAGTVAGTVAPLLALGMTEPGGRMLGNVGTLPQRMAAGAVSGGAISGADALARGDDLSNAGVKALEGLGLGGAFPMAERVISPVIKALIGQSVPRSVQSASRNLERDGVDIASLITQSQNLGPDAMLMDLGPNMTRQAGAIASLPGEGQTTLRNALVDRHTGTNARIQGDVNTTLGPAPIPSRVQSDIRAGQEALRPEYQEVLRGASPVDTTALAAQLDDAAGTLRGDAQRAVERVRVMLDETGNAGTLDQNPATLLQTRHAIDGLMDGLTDRNTIGALSSARREIDGLLAASVPGIKEVDAKFAELARQGENLQSGQQVLDSGRTALRPPEVADLVTEGANPQGLLVGPSGAAFRLTQGARAEIDRIIGTTGNNLTALKSALKGDGSWNRERLVSLFGQDKTDDLLNILDREQTYQRSYNTVAQNSETAARTAAQKEAAPHQFGSTSTSIADLLLKVPQGLANMGARSRSEGLNAEIANLLINPPSPELVDQLLAARRADRGRIGSAVVPYLLSDH